MTALDSRSITILLDILKSSGPISAASIAERMRTTPRIIRSSLARIENWLARRNLTIRKQPGKGLSINLSDIERRQLIREVENITSYNLILTREERVRRLIIALLTAEEPLLVKCFAPNLGVSRPTLFNDLEDVEQWFLVHDLKLIRRRGYGFMVQGSELKIRTALESVLFDTNKQIAILSSTQGRFLAESQAHNPGMLDATQISNICALPLDFSKSKFLVEKVEELSAFRFTDSSFLTMALFFCILIARATAGKTLTEFPFTERDLLDTKEYSIAQQVSQIINEIYDLELNQNETANIAVHILGIKGLQVPGDILTNSNSIMKDEDVEIILDDMIRDAAKLLHPTLTNDHQLRQGLLFHLKPAINRLHFGLPIQNPLLDEIRGQYAYVYWVAEKSAKNIENWLDTKVPDTEIGYLAMHFGAAMERLRSLSSSRVKVIIICGGGCATAWMLVSRLAAEFPELDVVDIKSAKDINDGEVDLEDVALIITTVPLQHSKKPIVEVTPLLSAEDKQLIHKILRSEQLDFHFTEGRNSAVGPSLASLLSREVVHSGLQAEGWEHAVDLSCAALVQNGSIQLEYTEAIKDLLRQHGPYMVLASGVALLHAMTGFGVNRVCMSLTKFVSPVLFGHVYNDPVQLALVIGSPDNHSHLRALHQLSRLLEDKDLMQTLFLADSGTDFFDVVRKVIQTVDEKLETK